MPSGHRDDRAVALQVLDDARLAVRRDAREDVGLGDAELVRDGERARLRVAGEHDDPEPKVAERVERGA